MDIDSSTTDIKITITAKVDRKHLNITTISVSNLEHLGRVYEAIGAAVKKVQSQIETEEAARDEA